MLGVQTNCIWSLPLQEMNGQTLRCLIKLQLFSARGARTQNINSLFGLYCSEVPQFPGGIVHLSFPFGAVTNSLTQPGASSHSA